MGNRKDGKNSIFTSDQIRSMYTYIGKIIKGFRFDEHTSLDISQEVMLKAYSSCCRFAGKSKFSSWVYAITRNYCINYKKRIYSKKPICFDFSSGENNLTASDNIENEFFKRELSKKLSSVLDGLPECLRKSLFFYYYEDLKYYQIAEKMKIPLGTVKSRINSAKTLVKARLMKETIYLK